MHAVYEEKRGRPRYDPRMMTKLLVYGYCTGVFSSRRIQKRLQEDIPFKVLAAGNEPDFRTISDFRKIHISDALSRNTPKGVETLIANCLAHGRRQVVEV